MESASLIKAVCRTDAATEPPWMTCFACLDQACRFHVRIAGWPEMHLPLTFQLHSSWVSETTVISIDKMHPVHVAGPRNPETRYLPLFLNLDLNVSYGSNTLHADTDHN